MSIRRTRKGRKGMAVAAITAGLVLTVAGCSGDGDGGDEGKSKAPSEQKNDEDKSGQEPEADTGGEPLAQVKGGSGISLSISTAKREEGGFVTVTGEVKNNGNKFWSGVAWKSDESEVGSANPASLAAAKLVDKQGKKRYYILRDTEGRCLCTSFKGGMQPGDSKTWYAQFPAPPEGNDKVDFQIADLPTASITVSGE